MEKLNNKSRNSKFSKIKIDNPVIDNLSVNTIGHSDSVVTFNSDIDVTNHDISVKDIHAKDISSTQIRAEDVSSTKIDTSILILGRNQVYDTAISPSNVSLYAVTSVSAENFHSQNSY